jgi:hypothetical protein
MQADAQTLNIDTKPRKEGQAMIDLPSVAELMVEGLKAQRMIWK